MSRKARRTYTREFKLEALELLKSSGKSRQALEKELGLGKGNLSRWEQELSQDGASAFPGKGRLKPEDERLRQLERENRVLRQERDILKKSAGDHLQGRRMKYAFIQQHSREYPIRVLCRVLGVRVSSY